MAQADDVYDWDQGFAYDWEFAGQIHKFNPYEVKYIIFCLYVQSL